MAAHSVARTSARNGVPARASPTIRSRTGRVAPSKSPLRTAKPSIALFSKGGMSTSETASRASTRLRAASRGIDSADVPGSIRRRMSAIASAGVRTAGSLADASPSLGMKRLAARARHIDGSHNQSPSSGLSSGPIRKPREKPPHEPPVPITSIPIPSSARSARFHLVFAACLAIPIAACSRGSGQASPQKNASIQRREPARVRTAAAEEREMVRTLSTTTVVESEREIKLFPRAAGVVTDLRVEEGDRVETGAVLAALDRRHTAAVVDETRVALAEAQDNVHKADIQKSEAESRVAAMKLKWEQANRDYERNEKAGLVSQQQLDNLRLLRDTAQNDHEAAVLAADRATIDAKAARTSVQKAELALQRVQLEDSYMQITAPFEGVIASRSIKVGDSVGPAAPAFVLTDASHLRAVFHRPQRELSVFLRAMPEPAGAPASLASASASFASAIGDGKGNSRAASPLDIRVTAEALPGALFRGELQLVSPSIDPQSGSFRVTVKLGAPIPDAGSSADPQSGSSALAGQAHARLLPGMLVRLEIVTERHPGAIAVPKRALRREGDQNLVFVVEDGHARRVEVDEGFADDEAVEVVARGGKRIAAGAKIIVIGNRELEEGAEVVEEIPSGENGPGKAADPLPADAKPADEKSDASKQAKG